MTYQGLFFPLTYSAKQSLSQNTPIFLRADSLTDQGGLYFFFPHWRQGISRPLPGFFFQQERHKPPLPLDIFPPHFPQGRTGRALDLPKHFKLQYRTGRMLGHCFR